MFGLTEDPSQPHLVNLFLSTRKSLTIIFYSEDVRTKENTVKLLKIIKKYFQQHYLQ